MKEIIISDVKMAKYRISVSIDEENFFWIVVDNGGLIKNPTEIYLKGARPMYYNKTNICPICREEINITDKSILYPGNARRDVDKEGKQTEEWVCKRHYDRNYQRHNPNSLDNIQKSLTGRRTGNLSYDRHIFGDDCEELTCRVFEVDSLNKKNDNYKSPIDHSNHHVLGVLQTKGACFNRYRRKWVAYYGMIEHEKQYDNMIVWCASENGETIERGYIIPKIEVNKRQGISIVKDPSRGIQWYEKYRIIDIEENKKINKIWKEIRSSSFGSCRYIKGKRMCRDNE